MATATSTAKRCVNCHKDVSNGKRMKDSTGRYWCLDCGAADQRKKSGGGELCGGCGERFPSAKLSKLGATKLCAGCVKRRDKGPGLLDTLRSATSGGGGGGGSDTKKNIMMVGAVVVLGLISWARWMKWF